MPDPVSGIIGAVSVGGSLLGGRAERKAAQAAGSAQIDAALAGVDEQARQFDELRKLLEPYVQAGSGAEGVQGALQAQQALVGLRGPDEQAAAIQGIERGPLFSQLARQGEESILQQASATGGLRGGNVQAALAQFRPQMLNQLIEQQYGRLGGLTQLGQASAAGVGAAGMNKANAVSDLLAEQGAARSGIALAVGKEKSQMFGDISGALGMGLGRLGGYKPPPGIF